MRAVAIIALLLLAGPGWARDVPAYGTYEWCSGKVPLGSTGVDGFPGCVYNEAQQAEALAAAPEHVPGAVEGNCDAYARRVGNGFGSYSALATCLNDKHKRR